MRHRGNQTSKLSSAVAIYAIFRMPFSERAGGFPVPVSVSGMSRARLNRGLTAGPVPCPVPPGPTRRVENQSSSAPRLRRMATASQAGRLRPIPAAVAISGSPAEKFKLAGRMGFAYPGVCPCGALSARYTCCDDTRHERAGDVSRGRTTPRVDLQGVRCRIASESYYFHNTRLDC